MNSITCCRMCKSTNIKEIFDFGDQALGCRFPSTKEPEPPSGPLVLVECQGECGLLQLRDTVSGDEMYKTCTYGYRSGLNETMKAHLRTIVEELYSWRTPEYNDIVLDIGSNDGTLLSVHSGKTDRVGIDPTAKQFRQYYLPEIHVVPDFFSYELFKKYYGDKKAKYITTISMFYDLPDPLKFTKDVEKVLDHDGIWIMEQSYMPTMLKQNAYDTVCHEHLEYYSLKQIEWLCDNTSLRILDVSLNDCNGGSFRVVIGHKNSSYKPNYKNIDIIKELDTDVDMDSFVSRVLSLKKELYDTLVNINGQGKKVALYGASTKGNTLLQFCNIDTSLILCAAERNEAKYGCRTPRTNIPIVSEEHVRQLKPDYMLVLPWHFKESFLKREKDYLESGGKFIFPLPQLEIIES